MALKGRDFFLARVKQFTQDFPNTVQRAMYQEAQAIAISSLGQCPVEFGRLRQSFVLVPYGDTSNPKILMSYGTDYAVYVHERVGLKHNPPTKAKFLEDPINASRETWLENVWRRTSAALKANGGEADSEPMTTTMVGTDDGTLR